MNGDVRECRNESEGDVDISKLCGGGRRCEEEEEEGDST